MFIYVLLSNDAVGSASICMISDGEKCVDGKYFFGVIVLGAITLAYAYIRTIIALAHA